MARLGIMHDTHSFQCSISPLYENFKLSVLLICTIGCLVFPPFWKQRELIGPQNESWQQFSEIVLDLVSTFYFFGPSPAYYIAVFSYAFGSWTFYKCFVWAAVALKVVHAGVISYPQA